MTIRQNFTFFSEAVSNSIYNFLDIWRKKSFSSSVSFCFYSPNEFTKERSFQRIKDLGIELPEKPILGYFIEKEKNDKAVEAAKVFILDIAKKEKNSELILSVVNWKNNIWCDFLEGIEFGFGELDGKELEKSIISDIKNQTFYRQSLIGREHFLLAEILNQLDKRQSAPNPEKRFLSGSEVKVIYLELASGEDKIDDPTWKQWESLQTSDKRGLFEKIDAVCNDADSLTKGTFSRKAASGMELINSNKEQKSLLSLRYRIFSCCYEVLAGHIKTNGPMKLNKADLNDQVSNLAETAHKKIEELKKDYHYPVSTKDSIEEILLELIDSCFLSFDKAGVDE